MDWLENYQAVIDCDDKTVTLHSPRKKTILEREEDFIL